MKLLYAPQENQYFIGNPSGPDYDAGDLQDVDAADLFAKTQIAVGLYHSDVIPSFDFEAFSAVGYYVDEEGKIRGEGSQGKGGLPAAGTAAYAEHPSTEVICLYYNLKDGQGRRGWFPGTPPPEPLLQYIRDGGIIEAWNVTFEFWIWNVVCVRKYGWPPLPLSQCRCAMAKSRRFSLPGSLDVAAKVLGTQQKDKRGKQLITKLTRPHTPTKKRTEYR